MRKLTFEFVKQYFEDQGCELLETKYINCDTKMKYRCNCGNISTIRYYNFKQGQRCARCSGTEKHTFEDVKQYFEDQGCELLEKTYINNRTKMKYKCSCGKKSITTFHNFKLGRKCKICGIKRRTEKKKHTFEDIQQYFKDQGCELLEKEYKNNKTKMKYKCSCGNISITTFNCFQKGHKCRKCGGQKIAAKRRYSFEYIQQYHGKNSNQTFRSYQM